MSDPAQLELLADFTAQVRRPRPLEGGLIAELFAANGRDADAVLSLGRSDFLDARVDVAIHAAAGEEMGGFQAYVRRPQPRMSGMIACFYGENGDAADAITALSLTKFQGVSVRVVVRLVQHADGRDAAPKQKGPHSAQASMLWQSAFLTRENIWAACGSDEDYLSWVRRQACCIKPQYGACDGDIVPMHVLRIANGAGKGIKPPYSAIPGCHSHHSLQHQHGESAVGGKAYYDDQRLRHLKLWVWEHIKRAADVESMADADPAKVRAWAAARNIEQYLPNKYR